MRRVRRSRQRRKVINGTSFLSCSDRVRSCALRVKSQVHNDLFLSRTHCSTYLTCPCLIGSVFEGTSTTRPHHRAQLLFLVSSSFKNLSRHWFFFESRKPSMWWDARQRAREDGQCFLALVFGAKLSMISFKAKEWL